MIRTAGALVAALTFTMISTTTQAGGSTGAQLGPIWTAGNLTSGGTLSYQLNLTVTSPGTLVAKADVKSRVKGNKWKATFPILTNTPIVGFSVVPTDVSPPNVVSIPGDFEGPALMRIKTYFNGRRVATSKVLVTISAPPSAPATPVSTYYDVGFKSNVVVSADVVSTNGMTLPLTYAWSITDTDIRTNATFSSASVATPTFNTLPITNFPINIDFIVDQEAKTMKVGIDTDQMEMSTYHLRVIVADAGSQSKTGTVTVQSTSVSPAQQSIPIGERQYFSRLVTNTYSWTLVGKPAGSTAVLENPTSRTPSLRPDVEGLYTIQDNRSGEQMGVKGATFVGVQTCAQCHGVTPLVGLNDKLSPWSQTGHATFMQRAVDGLVSPYYNESCLSCHTVGYNKAPLANNNGFDDVQRMLGWTFPSVLQYGNFSTIPSALQNKSNIQCESCHGPGSQHPGPASTSLDVAVCATCHQDGHYHTIVAQWERSPHSEPFFLVSEEEGINPSCAKCHSVAGFIDNSRNENPIRAEATMLSCQGCHDPHNENGYPHQVRYYDSVTIDPIDVTTGNPLVLPPGQGTSATCMFCHNSRRGPFQFRSGSIFYYLGGLSHESTATDVLLGLNACTNVVYVSGGVTNSLGSVKLENSAHSGVAKCVNCHMYPNPAIGQPDHDLIGGHTFSVRNVDTGDGNLPACNQCHQGVDTVSDVDHISVIGAGLPHGGDYDGDGFVSGVQTEVEGLKAILVAKALSTGMTYNPNAYPFWGGFVSSSSNVVLNAAQRAAAWNHWMIQRDLSQGIHNTAYTVRLLQWTYTILSTNAAGNSFAVDYPNADLR